MWLRLRAWASLWRASLIRWGVVCGALLCPWWTWWAWCLTFSRERIMMPLSCPQGPDPWAAWGSAFELGAVAQVTVVVGGWLCPWCDAFCFGRSCFKHADVW